MNKEIGGPAFPYGGHPGMTLRQYAAIKLKVPDSGTDWLDEMITKSRRGEFAVKAMEALIAHHGAYCGDLSEYGAAGSEEVLDVDGVAKYSYTQADAMLEARKS